MGWSGAGPGLGREGMPRELGDLVDADTGRLYYNVDVTYTRVAVNQWMRYKTREPQSRKPMGLNFSQATKDPLQKPLAKMLGPPLPPNRCRKQWVRTGTPQF